jgi:hypothetical protein
MDRSFQHGIALGALALLLAPAEAMAHGFAGNRFFPATIATDDPFVSDELSLPTVSTIRNAATDDSPANQETEVSVDFSKRITPKFGLGFGETWSHIAPKSGPSLSGFNNLDLSAKYLLLESDPHEFLFSIGLDAEVGGTGSKSIGADRFSTVTPSAFFGKGFGDLPDSLDYLKPLAVTGVLGWSIPTSARRVNEDGSIERHPHFLNTGLAIEYSLQYLQSNVRDIGLGAPFNRMIPLVEFNFTTPTDRGQRGQTTGTINPGLIWAGQYFQVGAEAIIPANRRSGKDIGAIVQLHFFLDDLFPNSIGKPIFGK